VKVLSGSGGWCFVYGAAAPSLKYEPDSNWKITDKSALQVNPGSALDLSQRIEAPAGKRGRVVVGATGTLAFADAPATPVRLLGFNRIPDSLWLKSSDQGFKQQAREFAVAARRQGYNLVRLNGLDGWLCADSKTDLAISPKFLDRWDFLLAELKKQGVYSHVTLFAYGFYSRYSGKDESRKRNAHKLMMYLGGKWERTHFRYGAETLFNHVNPYTGLAWKDDPAIAVVEFFNEQELGIKHIAEDIPSAFPGTFSVLQRQWRQWLVRKFNSTLSPELVRELKGLSLSHAPVPLRRTDTPMLTNEFSLFLMDKASESLAWCEQTVRAAGYPGLTSQYNFSKCLGDAKVRWESLQAVQMNTYFSHPSKFDQIGSSVGQGSSIEATADYWRELNFTRLAGRPFLVTEYNHSFWNPFQYEAGLLFGAYSALQGFDSLMVHAFAVMLDGDDGLNAFTVANNPICRANEFLVSCLFQRGDLKKSPHSVAVAIPEAFLNSSSNSEKALSAKQSKLGLMTGLALTFPWAEPATGLPAQKQPDMTLPPAGTSFLHGRDWFSNVVEDKNETFSLTAAVADLKKRGILPAANQSDPTRDIYQSDTGEITMRAQEKLLKVATARTEAVCLDGGKGETVNRLRVASTSVPACVAACSVDGQPLATSKRIVLIYSTVVVNDSMAFSADRRTLRSRGKMKVALMRTGKLEATLKMANGAGMALYALGLDGSRREQIPVRFADGMVQIDLDTSQLKKTTPFFELVKD
jgi:hypothetical protein